MAVWTPVNVNRVIWAYLNSEYHKHSEYLEALCQLATHPKLLTEPNFESPDENSLRYHGLMAIRRQMWLQLPPDVCWFEVSNFEFSAESRKNITVPWPGTFPEAKEVSLEGLITLTHDRKHLTIIEGARRVNQWLQGEPSPTVTATIYVGVTPSLCCWMDPGSRRYVHFHENRYSS